MGPVRIQLSRAKGFRLQETSLAINGLPCVKVDRSTRFGNRYRVWQQGRRISDGALTWVGCHDWETNYPTFGTKRDAAERAVQGFRQDFESGRLKFDIEDLRGSNIGCWCGLDMPCHGDVLLELANVRPSNREGE